MKRYLVLSLLVFMGFMNFGCSIRKMAVTSMADAMSSNTGSTFSADDDVELILEALPFGLKTMEALFEEIPDHKGLCISLSRGYLFYAYASVETKAEEIKEEDYDEYQRLRERSKKLYLRSYKYGFKGLELVCETFREKYKTSRGEALLSITAKEDVPLLYWTGAALAKWISVSKDDPAALIRLPEAAEFMERALELDPEYDNGSIHEFFVAYECRGSAMGGDTAKAKEHFHKALELSKGKKASVYLTYVEAFSIPDQNREEFRSYLEKVIDFDLDKYPEYRLANAIARRRAIFLLEREEDLFLGE
jgi:hypothetical protein